MKSGSTRLCVLYLCATAGGVLLGVGLPSSARADGPQTAEQVATLLRRGGIPKLAALLDDATAGGKLAEPSSGHRALYCRAQATVYRFGDARRERLCDPEETMGRTSAGTAANAESNRHRLFAHALTLSAIERAEMLSELQAAERAAPGDPQAAYLVATALAGSKDLVSADKALNRAVTLEPNNVIHLAAHVLLLERQGKTEQALLAVRRLLRSEATGPWGRVARSRVASRSFGAESKDGPDAPAEPPQTAAPVTSRNEIPDPSIPRVPRAELHLEAAADAWHRAERELAHRSLRRAAETVSFQAPFLIDYVDRLVEAGAAGLAAKLVTDNRWPQSNAAARAAAERALAAAADSATDPAPPPERSSHETSQDDGRQAERAPKGRPAARRRRGPRTGRGNGRRSRSRRRNDEQQRTKKNGRKKPTRNR